MRNPDSARSKFHLPGLFAIFCILLLLSACQAAPAVSPAPDVQASGSTTPAARSADTATPVPPTSLPDTPTQPPSSAPAQASPSAQPAESSAASTNADASYTASSAEAGPTASVEQPTQPAPTQTLPAASPTASSSTASGPAASATALCTDKAAFYGDVTIPDDTGFEQGVSFTKTWRFRNEGDCTWDETYAMVFAGGEFLNGPLSAPLAVRVAPGEIANLSIDLRTPDRGGVFRSYWQFQNPQGARFGTGAGGQEPFWAQVVVSWMPPGGGNSGAGSGGGSAGGSAGGSSSTNPPATPASGAGSPTATPGAGSGGDQGSAAHPPPPPPAQVQAVIRVRVAPHPPLIPGRVPFPAFRQAARPRIIPDSYRSCWG